MSMLDLIFKNPQPDRIVNNALYQLFMKDVILEAQSLKYSEERLIHNLTALPDYLAFLHRLKDSVVQEIADVGDQICGQSGQDNDKTEEN